MLARPVGRVVGSVTVIGGHRMPEGSPCIGDATRRSQYDEQQIAVYLPEDSRGCHGRHGLDSRRQVGGCRRAVDGAIGGE